MSAAWTSFNELHGLIGQKIRIGVIGDNSTLDCTLLAYDGLALKARPLFSDKNQSELTDLVFFVHALTGYAKLEN